MSEDETHFRSAQTRIRENMVGALGRFEDTADLIVGSHASNANLHALRTAASSSHCLPCAPSVGSVRNMTAAQMLQSMQSIVDAPLSTIETNLLFEKNQDRRAARVSDSTAPSTSANDVKGVNCDVDTRKKKKRKRGETDESQDKKCGIRDSQMPCSSAKTDKVENADKSITAGDSLGGKKQKADMIMKKVSEVGVERNDKKGTRWKKDDHESPDSGIVDVSAELERENSSILRVNSMIGTIGHISPLLSPPRKPSSLIPKLTYNDGVPSLRCFVDLSYLDVTDRCRIEEKLGASKLNVIPRLDRVLSPPRPPTLSIERVNISHREKNCHTNSDFKVCSVIKNTNNENQQAEGTIKTSKKKETDETHKELLSSSEELVRQKTPMDGLSSNNVEQGSSTSLPIITKLSNITMSSKPATPQSAIQGFGEKKERTSKNTVEISNEKIIKFKKDIVKTEKVEDKAILETSQKQVRKVEECLVKTEKSELEDGEVFTCCAALTAPVKKTEMEKNVDGTFKDVNFYLERARSVKHKADNETEDKLRRILLYFDSVAYYVICAARTIGDDDCLHRQYSLVRDVVELLRNVTNRFVHITTNYPRVMLHFTGRIKLMSTRTQAVLNYYLYSFKASQATRNLGNLSKHEQLLNDLESSALRHDGASSVNSQGSSAATATPSPASSTNSFRQKEGPQITLPLSIYQTQRAQLKILHYLMWADRLWSETNSVNSRYEQAMLKHLEEEHVCGPLSLGSDLTTMSEYLITAAAWLRTEYEMEKENVEQNNR